MMKEFINEFKIAHWGIKVLFIEFIYSYNMFDWACNITFS